MLPLSLQHLRSSDVSFSHRELAHMPLQGKPAAGARRSAKRATTQAIAYPWLRFHWLVRPEELDPIRPGRAQSSQTAKLHEDVLNSQPWVCLPPA